MRLMVLGLAALLFATDAMAQGGAPGGGGSGPPGGGGGPGGPGGPGGGGGASRPMQPVMRKQIDGPVERMFRAADGNRDGTVTLAELEAVVTARRDAIIRARFEKIDANRDGQVNLDEFMAWQRQMGSRAASEDQAVAGRNGPVSEAIEPDLGNKPGDRVLAMVIEPLSALTIVNANTNYDAGITLDELLAYERRRFDAADTDHDGALTMDEIREMARKSGRAPAGPGGPGPGGQPPGRPPERSE